MFSNVAAKIRFFFESTKFMSNKINFYVYFADFADFFWGKNERSLAQGKAPDYRMNRGVRRFQW